MILAGDTISDASGVLSGSVIANMVYNTFGKVAIGNNMFIFAEVVGIIIECLIGMTPLLFL